MNFKSAAILALNDIQEVWHIVARTSQSGYSSFISTRNGRQSFRSSATAPCVALPPASVLTPLAYIPIGKKNAAGEAALEKDINSEFLGGNLHLKSCIYTSKST
jgi:hypothetical protein